MRTLVVGGHSGKTIPSRAILEAAARLRPAGPPGVQRRVRIIQVVNTTRASPPVHGPATGPSSPRASADAELAAVRPGSSPSTRRSVQQRHIHAGHGPGGVAAPEAPRIDVRQEEDGLVRARNWKSTVSESSSRCRPSTPAPRGAGRAGATGRGSAGGRDVSRSTSTARKLAAREWPLLRCSRPASRVCPSLPVPAWRARRSARRAHGSEDPSNGLPGRRACRKAGSVIRSSWRDVGRRVHQVEASRGRLDQRDDDTEATAAGVQQRAPASQRGCSSRPAEPGVPAGPSTSAYVRGAAAARERGFEGAGGSAAVAARGEMNWRRRIRPTLPRTGAIAPGCRRPPPPPGRSVAPGARGGCARRAACRRALPLPRCR